MDYKYKASKDYTKKRNFNILIVDDDEQSSSLFKELLELRGHTVCSINEGGQCISKCQHNSYDIIFLDYHLEDINGVDLADFIKDIFKSKALIFAYTGDFSSQALSDFKNIGMQGAIIKPINPDLINQVMLSIEQTGNYTNSNIAKLSKRNNDSIILF